MAKTIEAQYKLKGKAFVQAAIADVTERAIVKHYPAMTATMTTDDEGVSGIWTLKIVSPSPVSNEIRSDVISFVEGVIEACRLMVR